MAAVHARSRYSTIAIALHWLMAILVIGNLAGGLAFASLIKNADPQLKALGFAIIQLHKAAGLTVLALALLRLLWRILNPPPVLPDHMTPLERFLAKATHWLFYVLILSLPLTGWLMTSASPLRFPISYFGLFDVPFLPIEQGKATAALLNDRHLQLGWLAVATIALHVAAALKHHYLDRDDVLARMLPWARVRT